MANIRLKEYITTLEGVTMDWLLRDNGQLDEREELASAVRVALGTDALADEDDVLPDPDSTDRRGWWGDMDAEEIWNGWPIGTKNWLLTRAKITQSAAAEGATLERAKQNTLNALQPFVDRQIASHADATATRATDLQTIEVDATVYRGPLAEIDLRYQQVWLEEAAYDGPQLTASRGKVIRVPYRALQITTTAPILKIYPITGQLRLSEFAPVVINTTSQLYWLRPVGYQLVLSMTAPTVVNTTPPIVKQPAAKQLVFSTTAPTVVRQG